VRGTTLTLDAARLDLSREGRECKKWPVLLGFLRWYGGERGGEIRVRYATMFANGVNAVTPSRPTMASNGHRGCCGSDRALIQSNEGCETALPLAIGVDATGHDDGRNSEGSSS
jgi:hypothetical protein